MSTALILGLALLAQSKTDPDQFPLALHRSMEIDDLDREITRLHDTVLLKKAQLSASQRLASRGFDLKTFVSPNVPGIEKDHNQKVFEHFTRALAPRAVPISPSAWYSR